MFVNVYFVENSNEWPPGQFVLARMSTMFKPCKCQKASIKKNKTPFINASGYEFYAKTK